MGDCLEFDINITVRQPQLACNDDVHGPPKRLRRAGKLHSKHFGLLSSERERRAKRNEIKGKRRRLVPYGAACKWTWHDYAIVSKRI